MWMTNYLLSTSNTHCHLCASVYNLFPEGSECQFHQLEMLNSERDPDDGDHQDHTRHYIFDGNKNTSEEYPNNVS